MCNVLEMSKNEMINFYEHKDVKKLMPKYKNPHFEQTQMNIPARICVIRRDDNKKFSHNFRGFNKIDDEDSDSD